MMIYRRKDVQHIMKLRITPQGLTFNPPKLQKIQGQINQSTTIHGLAPDTVYKFKIKAFNNNGASPISSEIECKTSDKEPLSDKLNLTFWWQITNSNDNIWNTAVPASGNNFQKLVGYYLSFLNYTHYEKSGKWTKECRKKGNILNSKSRNT